METETAANVNQLIICLFLVLACLVLQDTLTLAITGFPMSGKGLLSTKQKKNNFRYFTKMWRINMSLMPFKSLYSN